MRARHRLETDRITREKEQEMEQLHQRYTKPIENSFLYKTVLICIDQSTSYHSQAYPH